MAKGGDLSDIRHVYSHPQPLEQCGSWLRANLPQAELHPVESTAAAARKVAASRGGGAAAIGHERLAAMTCSTFFARGGRPYMPMMSQNS